MSDTTNAGAADDAPGTNTNSSGSGQPAVEQILPADLAALSPAELADLEASTVSRFDDLSAAEQFTAADLATLTALAEAVETLRGETERRTAAAAAATEQRDQLRARVHGAGGAVDGDDSGSGDDAPAASPAPTTAAAAAPASAPSGPATTVATPGAASGATPGAASGAASGATSGATSRATSPAQPARRSTLNASLARAQDNAPTVVVPQRREAALVAAGDIPGFAHGAQLGGMDNLVAAMSARARNMPVTHGAPTYAPIAYMERDHRFSLDENATPEQVNEVLVAATSPEILTAAGGWCAPSEISYDFFNVVCEDGLLDLPTVGVKRGGIRWPTSASFADIIGSASLWSWSETQDIAAATGTAQSGTKTCARVPCPSFNEARLGCDGLCLTVGNLTDYAFPELIENHTRLLMAGHAHYMNTRKINALVAGSTAVTYSTTGVGLVAPLLDAVEMQVTDYRERFRMCAGAVLEVVLPRWILPGMRADLAKRNAMDLDVFAVTNAMLAEWFDLRNVRVQLVTDWQLGAGGNGDWFGQATARTAWPANVQFLIYAPGTWVLGQGMRLDLGVVRDSVLNATNDHTAAWMEECYLLGQIGHQSLLVTVPICPNGATAAQISLGCNP